MTRLPPQPMPLAHAPGRRPGLPRGEYPSVIRHLAYAAGELARSPGQGDDLEQRFLRAEAVLRSLADAGWGRSGFPRLADDEPSPSVRLEPSAQVSLVELLADAWRRHGKPFPDRAIDVDMVEAAKQLLRELDWHLPA